VGQGLLYYFAVVLSPFTGPTGRFTSVPGSPPEIFPGRVNYADTLWIPCLALAIQTGVLLLLTARFMRTKDKE